MLGGRRRDQGPLRQWPEDGGSLRWSRWAIVAIAAVAVFALGTLLRSAVSDDRETGAAGSEDISTVVEVAVVDRPDVAARAALDAARSDPSTEAELAMLDVAVDGASLEQVVDTGSEPATAALALERLLVTATVDGSLKVWRREDGALLGETKTVSPLVVLADADSSSLVLAALDRRGNVRLADVSDPSRPRILAPGAGLTAGERPLAVAFSSDQVEVVAVGSGGEVLRLDQATGEVVERSSLREASGDLPWGSARGKLRLAVAKFVPEVYDQEEGLLLATAGGDVAGVDLADGEGERLLDASVVPGRVLSIDRNEYGTELAVGATGGYVVVGESSYDDEPSIERGPPVPGVAIDDAGGLWRGESGGVASPEENSPPGGPAVRALSAGRHGIVTLHGGGMVGVVGPRGIGISLEEAEASPAATFDAKGRLLLASGYDANHVEEIRAVRPQPRPPGDEYLEAEVLETYVPDPAWWPEADDPEAVYVNDLAVDDEYVIAGGQDPEGNAAVMVWDVESAKPLHHLSLGTGGIETSLPSIIAQVVPLPGKDAIAAYSAAQELVGIWSTESWELEDAIPVGAVGDLDASPDEETLVAVEFGGESATDSTDETQTLVFVDVESASVDHEVRLDGVSEAAFSPDGTTLAVAGEDGNLSFRSADGGEPVAAAVSLGDGAEDLAWRPDGASLAVALSAGGVALVDPRTGEAAGPLPHESLKPSLSLSWSSNGALLAAPTMEPEEEGEGYDPGAVDIWTLGASSLQQRMCQLAGCPPAALEEGTTEMPGDVSALGSVDLVFRRDGDLFAADRDGAVTWIARSGELRNPTPAYDWSEHGFAWSSPGQIGVLAEGSEQARTWPCPCSGIAWDGGEVVTVKQDGSALVRVDPLRGELRATPLSNLPPYYPTLLGVVAGVPVAAAFGREPDRSTYSRLYRLGSGGAAIEFPVNAHGYIFAPWPSASPRELAFIAGTSSGVCYSNAKVGIVSADPDGKLGVSFPPAPLGEEPANLRSVQVAADGTVSVAAGGLGCDEDGILEEEEPALERYLLEDGEWRPSGEQGYDVQAAGEGVAVIARPHERGELGALSYVYSSTRSEIAPEVEGVVGRP